MHAPMPFALAFAALAASAPAAAQITFYEHDGYGGRSFSSQRSVTDFGRQGFNDRASSVLVSGDRWEVCEDAAFRGRCALLRRGRYPSLAAMGLNDRISSARVADGHTRVGDRRAVPVPEPVYDDRRRGGERLYEADVTGVRAVVGPVGQRCWMEREQVAVPARRGDASVGGGILGAVIGGILGHQVGGGTGRDIATVGGAVAGAAIGANVGRSNNSSESATRDVQRCAADTQPARPDFWDVSYVFRGTEHHVQMTEPPGATVTVNRQGEPRR